EQFVRDFLAERLGIAEIYQGHHFAFGRGKRGDLEMLRRLGPECGFVTSGIDEVLVDGEPVSSTRIREAIGRGDVAAACRMLGHEYEMEGIVSRGERVGRRSATRPSTSLPKTSSTRPTASTSPRSRSSLSGSGSTASPTSGGARRSTRITRRR